MTHNKSRSIGKGTLIDAMKLVIGVQKKFRAGSWFSRFGSLLSGRVIDTSFSVCSFAIVFLVYFAHILDSSPLQVL